MNPKVSIITAVYNQGEYIDQCLKSVINQSYDNWELIIIDDCSTDYSVNIIDLYKKRFKHIKYIRNKKRLGVENLHKTYNKALKLAEGEYVAFLEGDDWWPKDKLKKQMSAFKNNKIILSYGDAIITRVNGSPIDIVSYKGMVGQLNNNPPPSILIKFADFNFFLLVSTIIIHKKTLLDIGGFKKDPHFVFVDVPTWYELSLRGNFSYCNEILGYYRKHKNSSWIEAAKNSDAMLRTEMQKMYWFFIQSNRSKTELINLLKDELLKTQQKALEKKRINKQYNLFLNTIFYDDVKLIKNAGNIVLNDKKIGFMKKVVALVVMDMGYLIYPALFLLFQFKLKKYNLGKVLKFKST